MRRRHTRAQPPGALVGWFRERLLAWFPANGRSFSWRNEADEYRTFVAESLLQRTTAAAVDDQLSRFLARFPTWDSLRDAEMQDLESVLRPLGLWRRRAASLKELAEVAAGAASLPAENAELRRLPGVGQYIANAVSLVVHGERRPLLDSNMARVLERFFGPRDLADIRFDPYLQALAHRVVDSPEAKAVNWAILDMAALICRPVPRCNTCPVAARCAGRRPLTQDERPAMTVPAM
jgi:A/G-specific adenine glycosylase